MLDGNTFLNLLAVGLLSVGVFLLDVLRKTTIGAAQKGAEKAAELFAEEAGKARVFPAELARELQKTRSVERQEHRFQSYRALWKELRPLALYDDIIINKQTMETMSAKLSDWYFSDTGGLLLTPQARDFYFALQGLLRDTSRRSENWSTDRTRSASEDPKNTFRNVLEKRQNTPEIASALEVFEYFDWEKDDNAFRKSGVPEDWQTVSIELGEKWRKGIKALSNDWHTLDEGERFAALQQVGSILRTTLATNLESRLR